MIFYPLTISITSLIPCNLWRFIKKIFCQIFLLKFGGISFRKCNRIAHCSLVGIVFYFMYFLLNWQKPSSSISILPVKSTVIVDKKPTTLGKHCLLLFLRQLSLTYLKRAHTLPPAPEMSRELACNLVFFWKILYSTMFHSCKVS